MAGHSHWKSIKHKKAVVDARRGKQWSKLARLIIIATKNGANPDDNLALRYAIDKARAANMPNDTIDKNVKRGCGEFGSDNFENITYEGYGPGGIAILVEALSNNRNRTAGEIRTIFDHNGGSMGATNSVAWMFSRKGVINIERAQVAEDKLMELAIEAGAEDVQVSEEGYEIITAMTDFEPVRKALVTAIIALVSAEFVFIPSQTVQLSGEKAESMQALIEMFEENDDVQNVFTNADFQ